MNHLAYDDTKILKKIEKFIGTKIQSNSIELKDNKINLLNLGELTYIFG